MTSGGGATDERPSAGLSRLQLAGMAGGAALVPLNSTMVAVALRRIARSFDISVGTTGLLVTVYLVAMLVGQPLAGRLGDLLGHRRIVQVALVGFALTSVTAALSTTFWMLVAGRVGQALCGAAIGPGVQAMLRLVTPSRERGQTFGLFGSIIGIGAAAGPVIGGGLIELFGWRAVFLVNVPIVAWALLAAPRGPGSPAEAQRRAEVDGPTWTNRVFLACFAVQALTTVGQYTLLLVTPVILDARGWSSLSIGLALSTLTVGLIVMGPIGGRAGDRRGRRWPVSIGIGVTAVAISVSASGGASLHAAAMIAALTTSGLGLGFVLPSVMTAAIESVDERRAGTASGILSMSRYLGSITASLVVSAWIADDGGGAGRAFWVATVASVAALSCSSLLPSHGRLAEGGHAQPPAVHGADGAWSRLAVRARRR